MASDQDRTDTNAQQDELVSRGIVREGPMVYEIDTMEKVLAAMDSMKAEIARWRTRCEQAEARAERAEAWAAELLGVPVAEVRKTTHALLRDTEGGSERG